MEQTSSTKGKQVVALGDGPAVVDAAEMVVERVVGMISHAELHDCANDLLQPGDGDR